jgi:hypothetical protein
MSMDGAKKTIWLKKIAIELGLHEYAPTTIWCDNQSAIKLVKILYFMQKHSI